MRHPPPLEPLLSRGLVSREPGLTARPAQGHGQAEGTAAHLRIRAGRPARRRSVDLKALWQRWLDGPDPAHGASDAGLMRVEVTTGPGRPLFLLSDPQGTVEITVGPGTYDITVIEGRRKRRYTVTLDPGATFNLDLQDAMQAD